MINTHCIARLPNKNKQRTGALIKVYCAVCGRELYITGKLLKPLDETRYCIKHLKERPVQTEAKADALRGPKLTDSVEQFLDEVVKNL